MLWIVYIVDSSPVFSQLFVRSRASSFALVKCKAQGDCDEITSDMLEPAVFCSLFAK